MLNRRSTFIQNINNRKGQVALFIALAFQILFVFFAMVINVGLLVHHKINLQNSVDLAAYYGAMKQAENLNAIAHINYQIRQSWKLLSWRYRMLGTAGEFEAHPYRKQGLNKFVDPNLAVDDIYHANQNYKNWQIAPPFCISYIPFKEVPPSENTCKYVANRTSTVLWQTPPFISNLSGITGSVRNLSQILANSAIERCKFMGSINFLTLAKFVVAFNFDQRDRMEFISLLSRGTSYQEDDFFDLDGQSVKLGIEKTLLNNLTSANRESLVTEGSGSYKVFNSLGSGDCNAQGLAEGQPAKWLQAIRILPGFKYVDNVCGGQNLATDIKNLSNQIDDLPRYRGEVGTEQDVNVLAPFIGFRQNLNDNFNFSVGVEKNPWCMAYVGVSAVSRPKIPFSPFGTVALKARGFYKPFGGRVGPWYYKQWLRGPNTRSTGSLNERIDSNLPPRITDISQFGIISEDVGNAEFRAANYSRYVGDNFGLKSLKMLGYYGQAIFNLDDGWRNGTAPTDVSSDSPYVGNSAPAYSHWEHLPLEFNQQNGSGDMLAWDSGNQTTSAMRVLETAAILPDSFDIAYYSIDPDFYHNYYLKILNGYLKGPGQGITRVFRPDIGYRRTSQNFAKYNIKEQYKTVKDPFDVVKTKDLISQHFTYITENWMHLLTSWAPVSLTDYTLDTNKFGKCQTMPVGEEENDPKPATSGNCVSGGTTGYSVKMVSTNFLRSSDLKLGGENVSAGSILNPPPADEDF